MTAPIFSLSLSPTHRPPTRGPVMIRPCEREGARTRTSENLGRLSDCLTCIAQACLAPRRPCNTGDYATCGVTGAAAANGSGAPRQRVQRQRAPRRPRLPTNQRRVPAACTHKGTWPGYSGHVSRGPGGINTVVLCPK